MSEAKTTKETIIKGVAALKGESSEIARENTRAFLMNNAGTQDVVVDFVKKNDEPRTMIIRTGVPGKKGGVNKVEALDRSYLTVFDTQKDAHRTLNLRTLTKITVKGHTLTVV